MFVFLLFIAIILVTYLLKRNYEYWQDRKLYFNKPELPFGNAGELFKQRKSFGAQYNDLYAQAKKLKQPHAGFFFCLTPQYVPVKLEIIKSILLKDFQHFHDRGVYHNEKDDPLGTHLFTMEGIEWRHLRAKISPTFTAGKIKIMFPTVVKITEELVNVLKSIENKKGIEIKELLARLTTDIIGDCAFGLECNSLNNPEAEFRSVGRSVFTLTVRRQLLASLTFVFPDICRFFGVRQQPKDVTDFFLKVIDDTVRYREENGVDRNDFINLMLEIRNRGKLQGDDADLRFDGKTLTIEQIAAQSFIFFLGGFETSSTAMSFCLYELCRNRIVQSQVRREVEEVFGKHGELTYEALGEMSYMDMVINETLRKYPPLPILNRICTRNYRIPGTDLVLEKGTQVVVPVKGIHFDEEFYPDPENFDPERFSSAEKRKRNHFAFLPFGEGPRVCIGMRFGLLQMKVGLSLLLKNYRFKLNNQMSVPLVLDKSQFITSALGGIFVDVETIA